MDFSSARSLIQVREQPTRISDLADEKSTECSATLEGTVLKNAKVEWLYFEPSPNRILYVNNLQCPIRAGPEIHPFYLSFLEDRALKSGTAFSAFFAYI